MGDKSYEQMVAAAAKLWTRQPRLTVGDDQFRLYTQAGLIGMAFGVSIHDTTLKIAGLVAQLLPEPRVDRIVTDAKQCLNPIRDALAELDGSDVRQELIIALELIVRFDSASQVAKDYADRLLELACDEFNRVNPNDEAAALHDGRFIIAPNAWWEHESERLG